LHTLIDTVLHAINILWVTIFGRWFRFLSTGVFLDHASWLYLLTGQVACFLQFRHPNQELNIRGTFKCVSLARQQC